MIDLLQVYVCMKCGDILSDEVYIFEAIDTKLDDVEVYWLHDKCDHEAVPKHGPVYEHVDHERWLWAQGFYDDPSDSDEDEEYFD